MTSLQLDLSSQAQATDVPHLTLESEHSADLALEPLDLPLQPDVAISLPPSITPPEAGTTRDSSEAAISNILDPSSTSSSPPPENTQPGPDPERIDYLIGPNGLLTLRGCLSDPDDTVDILEDIDSEFTRPNNFLSDSLVTFLIFHTCWNLYPSLKDELIVISPIKFTAWNAVQTSPRRGNPKASEARAWKSSNRWKTFRMIAFVVIKNDHFSLGVLFNEAWQRDLRPQPPPSWTLFHFNSLPSFTSHPTSARKFAAFAVQCSEKEIALIKVPVPKQPDGSNACGVFTHHFFRVFFEDEERSIRFCKETSVGLKSDSPQVQEFWQGDRAPSLLQEARSVMKFYESLYKVAKGAYVETEY